MLRFHLSISGSCEEFELDLISTVERKSVTQINTAHFNS